LALAVAGIPLRCSEHGLSRHSRQLSPTKRLALCWLAAQLPVEPADRHEAAALPFGSRNVPPCPTGIEYEAVLTRASTWMRPVCRIRRFKRFWMRSQP